MMRKICSVYWEEGNYIGCCDWCDREFRFETHVSISYSTVRMGVTR